MKEKGFATIFGLCLILSIALVSKGIQESEMNHAYETINFQSEFDLQNAADSGIYEAIKYIKKNPNFLPKSENPYMSSERIGKQKKLPLEIETKKNIRVEVWGERIALEPYKVIYSKEPYVAQPNGDPQEGYVFLSKAEKDSENMDVKIYRRAYAYVSLKNNVLEEIYFMELPTNNYVYKN